MVKINLFGHNLSLRLYFRFTGWVYGTFLESNARFSPYNPF